MQIVRHTFIYSIYLALLKKNPIRSRKRLDWRRITKKIRRKHKRQEQAIVRQKADDLGMFALQIIRNFPILSQLCIYKTQLFSN